MPSHTHPYTAATSVSGDGTDVNSGSGAYALTAVNLATDTTNSGESGNDQPHENMPPFAVARWIVKT